jgi:hypothetical protein
MIQPFLVNARDCSGYFCCESSTDKLAAMSRHHVPPPAAGSAPVERHGPFPTICCFYNCGKQPGSDKVQRNQHPDEPRWVGSMMRTLANCTPAHISAPLVARLPAASSS